MVMTRKRSADAYRLRIKPTPLRLTVMFEDKIAYWARFQTLLHHNSLLCSRVIANDLFFIAVDKFYAHGHKLLLVP